MTERQSSFESYVLSPNSPKHSDLSSFLSSHIAKKGDVDRPVTHSRIGSSKNSTIQPKVFGGSYHIPDEDMEEFNELYHNHRFVKKRPEYLTAFQLSLGGGPMVLDLDMKYNSSVDSRQHNQDFIIDFLSICLSSLTKCYIFNQGEWSLSKGYSNQVESDHHVVAFDYGIKKNILRMLVSRRCKVTVVPAETSYEEVVRLKPDGVFLSNGPGDPEPCGYAIQAIKKLVDDGYPTFGICLGHQLLALASGAKTSKMKFGHHGANHPVQDLKTKRVFITSQNHGFTVDQTSLPKHLLATHQSLFDGSLQGIERSDQPAFSFQGHPEASPGPSEMSYLFDHFIDLIEKKKKSYAKA